MYLLILTGRADRICPYYKKAAGKLIPAASVTLNNGIYNAHMIIEDTMPRYEKKMNELSCACTTKNGQYKCTMSFAFASNLLCM